MSLQKNDLTQKNKKVINSILQIKREIGNIVRESKDRLYMKDFSNKIIELLYEIDDYTKMINVDVVQKTDLHKCLKPLLSYPDIYIDMKEACYNLLENILGNIKAELFVNNDNKNYDINAFDDFDFDYNKNEFCKELQKLIDIRNSNEDESLTVRTDWNYLQEIKKKEMNMLLEAKRRQRAKRNENLSNFFDNNNNNNNNITNNTNNYNNYNSNDKRFKKSTREKQEKEHVIPSTLSYNPNVAVKNEKDKKINLIINKSALTDYSCTNTTMNTEKPKRKSKSYVEDNYNSEEEEEEIEDVDDDEDDEQDDSEFIEKISVSIDPPAVAKNKDNLSYSAEKKKLKKIKKIGSTSGSSRARRAAVPKKRRSISHHWSSTRRRRTRVNKIVSVVPQQTEENFYVPPHPQEEQQILTTRNENKRLRVQPSSLNAKNPNPNKNLRSAREISSRRDRAEKRDLVKDVKPESPTQEVVKESNAKALRSLNQKPKKVTLSKVEKENIHQIVIKKNPSRNEFEVELDSDSPKYLLNKRQRIRQNGNRLKDHKTIDRSEELSNILDMKFSSIPRDYGNDNLEALDNYIEDTNSNYQSEEEEDEEYEVPTKQKEFSIDEGGDPLEYTEEDLYEERANKKDNHYLRNRNPIKANKNGGLVNGNSKLRSLRNHLNTSPENANDLMLEHRRRNRPNINYNENDNIEESFTEPINYASRNRRKVAQREPQQKVNTSDKRRASSPEEKPTLPFKPKLKGNIRKRPSRKRKNTEDIYADDEELTNTIEAEDNDVTEEGAPNRVQSQYKIENSEVNSITEDFNAPAHEYSDTIIGGEGLQSHSTITRQPTPGKQKEEEKTIEDEEATSYVQSLQSNNTISQNIQNGENIFSNTNSVSKSVTESLH